MHSSSTEGSTRPSIESPERHAEPALARLKDAIESTRDWASKLNDEILMPNVRALMAAAHPNPQVATVIVVPFLFSVMFATAFVVLSFLSVIGLALVAITASVALVFMAAFVSVAIKMLIVASAAAMTTRASDPWRNRSLQRVLKHSRSIIIAVVSAVGALLLRKPVGKLLRKLFRSNNNNFVRHPIRLPEIRDPPICRGPHQQWPQHSAIRPSYAQYFPSTSRIIGGRQPMATPSFPVKVVGKVTRIVTHISLYIAHLVRRAIVRGIDQVIRKVFRLVRKTSIPGFILAALVLYVFVLHYKLRGSKKGGNKEKETHREDIREGTTAKLK